ncbi:single-stranded-DNA-specific exonuclease RecJ [soil metagenome]
MIKKWNVKPPPEPELVKNLSSVINVNPVLATILLQREINNYEEAKSFFRPSLLELHDPFLMKNMDKAVIRLQSAISNNEKILIYGDYDVDGTTSVALFYGFLKNYYTNLEYYIPDRYKEGYGISFAGIEWAEENGISLIVSLDCGIKAVEKVKMALEKGIDFIICDHHRPGDELPEAHAILDPKQEDCDYPFDELSGCGIGFKLLQAYCLSQNLDPSLLHTYLDLVVVSIASDIVPIIGENRILAFFGLKQLNTNPRPGLKALIEIAGLKEEISISKIVFAMGPRINAAGRIAHAHSAVQLLLSTEKEEADIIAKQVNLNNTLRRDHDSNITQEALEMIQTDEVLLSSKSTVLFKNDWHKGVIGIVASRCIEKHYKPTIILTESNQMASGSARSVLGFDVYEAISECADLLSHFGGHKYAAGLTLQLDNVSAFKTKFEEVVSRTITEEQLVPALEIDQFIDLDFINFKIFNILKQMEPFGPANMQPVFASENLVVKGKIKLIKDEHLRFNVQQEGSIACFPVIGFCCASFLDKINAGQKFRMAYTIENNEYQEMKSLQLCVKDISFYN